MKNLLFTFLLIITFTSATYAQCVTVPTTKEKKVVYTQLTNITGKTQAELYAKVKQWQATAQHINTTAAYVDNSDKSKLIYKGVANLTNYKMNYILEYTIANGKVNVAVKDIYCDSARSDSKLLAETFVLAKDCKTLTEVDNDAKFVLAYANAGLKAK